MQGCARVYRGIQGYTGVCKGMHGYTRVYRGIQEYTGIYKGIQWYPRVYRGIQRDTEGIQNALDTHMAFSHEVYCSRTNTVISNVCCLPTKLASKIQ